VLVFEQDSIDLVDAHVRVHALSLQARHLDHAVVITEAVVVVALVGDGVLVDGSPVHLLVLPELLGEQLHVVGAVDVDGGGGRTIIVLQLG